MTVLSAIQSAAVRLISRKPSTVFSAEDAFSIEMQDLANEVARDIAKSTDWQALITVHTITGNGTDTAFPLPDDYDRMLVDSSLYDGNNWAWGYTRIMGASNWLRMDIERFGSITPGGWTILGNEFRFVPAPTADSTAKFVYVSNNIVISENNELKTSFETDSDRFVLDERLLTLGLIWKWREMKRLEAATDQANFEKAFAEISGRDKGSQILRIGRSPWNTYDVNLAYPRPLGVS
jgi:hypothetical protein